MGTSIKTAMGFFGKGNWLSKALTILMTAVSLAFFALASMGYTYDQLDYLTKSYRRFLQRKSYLVFHAEMTGFTPDLVDWVKKETAVDYFSAFPSLFDVQNYVYGYSPVRPDLLQRFYNSPFAAGSEALMDEMGFDVVAGRRPEGPNETMISLDVFEAFRVEGFKDRADDGTPQRAEIAAYSDILGKSVLITGKTDLRAYIVGVFDNTKAKQLDSRWEYLGYGPISNVGNAKFVFANSFLEELNAIGRSLVGYLYAPVNEEILKPKKVESYIRVSEELLRLNEDFLRSEFAEVGDAFDLYCDQFRYMYGAYQYSASLGHYIRASAGGMYLVDYYVMILCGIGGVLLVMAVIFNTYLITDTMYRARRQIGVLRSLGYKKGKIAKIILLSALGLALLTFLVALLVTVTLYYGWFRALVTSGDGVLFEFSIWTVLILFGTSLLIPLISSVVPLLLFFKRPIVENIKARE